MGQGDNLPELVSKNWREFGPEYDDAGFAETLTRGVTDNQAEIDALIVKYAPEWPLEQITNVDRNVLRLGIYELKFNPDMPPKVAINEAIELAKSFGGESSGRFVNGVLGSIYRDMVAQGEKVELAAPPRQTSAGGVVYRHDPDGSYSFALIEDATGRWTFAKGKIADGEDLSQAASREVSEELGITDLTVGPKVGEIEITVNEPGQRPRPKTVHYFLMETHATEVRPQSTPELRSAGWHSATETWRILGYENARGIFQRALELLGYSLPEASADEPR